MKKKKPAASVDTARRYGTLLATRPRPLKDPTKNLVKYREDGDIDKHSTTDADTILPSAAAILHNGDDRAGCVVGGSHRLGYGRGPVEEERKRHSDEKTTHSVVNNLQRTLSTCAAERRTGGGLGDLYRAPADGVGQGLPAARPIRNYLGDVDTNFRAVNCLKRERDSLERANRLRMDGPERKAIAEIAGVEREPGSRFVETDGRDNKSAVSVHHASMFRGKERENITETLASVGEADGDSYAEEEGVPLQRSPDGDDDLKSTKSEYGEESFESADGSQESGVRNSASSTVPADLVRRAGVRVENDGLIIRDDGDGDHGAGICGGSRPESASLRCGVAREEKTSRESAAALAATAVLRIEACWRGFLGRRAARCALRSMLLRVLRNLGGGKISKVHDAHMKINGLRSASDAPRVIVQHHVLVRFEEVIHNQT